MIKLKNIAKNDSVISCEIYPEGCIIPGTLSCDVNRRDIIEYHLPEGYEWCKKHVYHALETILSMVDKDELLKEKCVMWI